MLSGLSEYTRTPPPQDLELLESQGHLRFHGCCVPEATIGFNVVEMVQQYSAPTLEISAPCLCPGEPTWVV